MNFRAMQMILLIHEHAAEPFKIDSYLNHVRTYIQRIDHLRGLFEAGRDKQTVRDCITNLHRPKEYWEQKAKEIGKSG